MSQNRDKFEVEPAKVQKTEVRQLITKACKVDWGRGTTASWAQSVGTGAMVFACPSLILIYWISLEKYNGSLTTTVRAVMSTGLPRMVWRGGPNSSVPATSGYAGWLLLQAALYSHLPGVECLGQYTPGGHQLKYTTNGLLAWALIHLLFLLAAVLGLLDPAIIANNWEGLLWAVNIYGLAMAAVAQVKGHVAPSYPEDRKISGSFSFDFFAGVELNPRFGKYFDLKFFHNGRPGIVAWTLIDISWACYQRQAFGHVTKAMLLLMTFHVAYVVDFFYNEDWYTRTIDISHDHFGFMLAWGDTAFLPTFYTLQAQYLARRNEDLTNWQALTILAIGVAGYAIFRSANYQRDFVRARDGNATLWGRPVSVIRCTYQTNDAKEHNSLLLSSGWWGFSRHANYLGDLILSFAMCATCGTRNILPWSYFFYMLILLVHRAHRDEERCSKKYCRYWDEYCKAVPYRLVPGVF